MAGTAESGCWWQTGPRKCLGGEGGWGGELTIQDKKDLTLALTLTQSLTLTLTRTFAVADTARQGVGSKRVLLSVS